MLRRHDFSAKELTALAAQMPEIEDRLNRRLEPHSLVLPMPASVHTATAPQARPAAEVVDFGIRMPRAKTARKLSYEECRELLGDNESLRANFVPQMLVAVIMHHAALLVNYCRDNRIDSVKKHTRVLRAAVEEYTKRLAAFYGPVGFRAYEYYVGRYFDATATDRWLMAMEADAICRNQIPGQKHAPIAVHALICALLITFVNDLDGQFDKVLSDKVGQKVNSKPDVYRLSIHAMCVAIAEDFGYKITPTEQMAQWVKVLCNRAWFLADEIVEEEKQ